ncbi:MAG: hypothetical protein WD972_03685 [Candidatus Andersenbacteria bacterium]
MNRERIASTLLWAVALASLIGGIGAYRYFLTAPELRFPSVEARWQLLPFGLLLGLTIALLLKESIPSRAAKNDLEPRR